MDDLLLPITEPVGRHSLRFQRVRVLVAVQCLGTQRVGSIRVARVPTVSAVTVARFLRRNLAPGSVVVTDAARSMAGALVTLPYSHRPEGLGLSDPARHRPLQRCHSIGVRLTEWLTEVHAGAVDHHHVTAYLDDFAFRFNRRHVKDRGRVWFELVEGLMTTPIDRVRR